MATKFSMTAGILLLAICCSFGVTPSDANGNEPNSPSTKKNAKTTEALSPLTLELMAVAKASGFRYDAPPVKQASSSNSTMSAPTNQPLMNEDIAKPSAQRDKVLYFEGIYGLNMRYPGVAWYKDGQWHFKGGLPPHLEDPEGYRASHGVMSYNMRPISHPTRYQPRPISRIRPMRSSYQRGHHGRRR